MRIKIMFANVIQCMIHCGYNKKKENIFAGFHPEKYVEYFKNINPDILCMAECLMDDIHGKSKFVEDISDSCNLPYCKNLTGERAFFVNNKFYGLSICSRFPFSNYKVLKLANPKIETIRPNGEHWVMHDKYVQKASLKIDNENNVNIINTHMFPFQHFNKHFWDDEFKEYRNQWAEMLVTDNQTCIMCGDFNTVGISINKAFPELQIGKKLYSLVSYDGKKYQPKYPYDTQIEYITKSINPQSSISAVCLKKKITGHGLKSVAYGYGWCFAEEADHNRYIDGKFYKGNYKDQPEFDFNFK